MICVADRGKLAWKVWTKWWLCEALARGRSGALTVQRSILTWIHKQHQALSAFLFSFSCFRGLAEGRDFSSCVHWRCIALRKTSFVMNYEPFVILNVISGLREPAWLNLLPRPSLEASSFPAWQLQILPPSPLRGFGGVRVPQVPHITPQLRPPVQPSQHAASWPPVDAGRLNVTHIIIHHRGELGKEGRDWGGAGVREEGGQGRTLFVQGS